MKEKTEMSPVVRFNSFGQHQHKRDQDFGQDHQWPPALTETDGRPDYYQNSSCLFK